MVREVLGYFCLILGWKHANVPAMVMVIGPLASKWSIPGPIFSGKPTVLHCSVPTAEKVDFGCLGQPNFTLWARFLQFGWLLGQPSSSNIRVYINLVAKGCRCLVAKEDNQGAQAPTAFSSSQMHGLAMPDIGNNWWLCGAAGKSRKQNRNSQNAFAWQNLLHLHISRLVAAFAVRMSLGKSKGKQVAHIMAEITRKTHPNISTVRNWIQRCFSLITRSLIREFILARL